MSFGHDIEAACEGRASDGAGGQALYLERFRRSTKEGQYKAGIWKCPYHMGGNDGIVDKA